MRVEMEREKEGRTSGRMGRPSSLHHYNRTRAAQRPREPFELIKPLFGREEVEEFGYAHANEC